MRLFCFGNFTVESCKPVIGQINNINKPIMPSEEQANSSVIFQENEVGI